MASVKKEKGSAKIFINPDIGSKRAIVSNNLGVFFDGNKFDSVELAKASAEAANHTKI